MTRTTSSRPASKRGKLLEIPGLVASTVHVIHERRERIPALGGKFSGRDTFDKSPRSVQDSFRATGGSRHPQDPRARHDLAGQMRRYSAGTSLRRARSPVAPNSTMSNIFMSTPTKPLNPIVNEVTERIRDRSRAERSALPRAHAGRNGFRQHPHESCPARIWRTVLLPPLPRTRTR